jgi:hypothetical protein
MSTESVEPGHGHSPAAWTAVIIMLVAFVIGTVAFCLETVAWLVWVAAVIVLIGLVVGWVMKRSGYGVNGPKYTPKGH